MSIPEQIYEELLRGTPEQPGRAYRAFYGPAGMQIRAFVDGSNRLPGLALRVGRNRVPAGMSLPRIRGAAISVISGDTEMHSGDVTYEFAAADRSFTSVFIELASRLITDATIEPSAEIALLRVSRRVASWARFFDARGPEGLGRSAQLGLIGELLCLERLGALTDFARAVDSWTGPTGTTHDFQVSGGAVEVKLTTSSTPERFRITSERQLDDSAVPWLALFAVIAQETPAGHTNLADVVDRIRLAVESAAPGAAALLEERLLEAGYSDADRERYDMCISVRKQEFIHVTGDLPRVRPGELRSGVFAVSYDVTWAAIAPYRISDDEVRRVFSVGE